MRKLLLGIVMTIWFQSNAFTQEQNVFDLQDIIDIENTFSNASKEIGFRMANLAYAADDATVFRPDSINAKKWSLSMKDTSFVITWYASFADMSAAGDLGYAVGPFENRSTTQGDSTFVVGQFATVWKRQKDGSLKFIMDFGSNRLPPSFHLTKEPPFQPAKMSKHIVSKVNVEKELNAVLETEKKFATLCLAEGDLNAYQAFASPDIRFFYQREFYVHGLEAVKATISNRTGKHSWSIIKSAVSGSGDMAHIYGTNQYKEGDSTYSGYYMRIWKKQTNGSWMIVLQVRSSVK